MACFFTVLKLTRPPREMLQSHQKGKKEKTMGRESRKMVQLNLICKD